MKTSSLKELAALQFSTKLYVAKLKSPPDIESLGVPLLLSAQDSGAEVQVIRFLGLNHNSLDCSSTIIFGTNYELYDEKFSCKDSSVFSLLAPKDISIRYLDLQYGHDLLGSVTEAPFGERTDLVLENLSGRDMHIEISGDIRNPSNPYRRYFPHHDEFDVESKFINFGAKATYSIDLWKNDAGNRGEWLGAFRHGVRYNAAGRSDRLEFTMIDTGPDRYIKVWSIRELGQVALLLWLGALAGKTGGTSSGGGSDDLQRGI